MLQKGQEERKEQAHIILWPSLHNYDHFLISLAFTDILCHIGQPFSKRSKVFMITFTSDNEPS